MDYEVTIQLVNTPPETRPDFSATAKIITDTRVVADADRERIFEPFARLESTNGEGSGLGLALVEQQVDADGRRRMTNGQEVLALAFAGFDLGKVEAFDDHNASCGQCVMI